MCKEVENENKALKKSMEFLIKEKVVLKGSECYDWAEELPELKTGAPKKCLVYHLAGYAVRKPSRITDCGVCAVTLLSLIHICYDNSAKL